MICRWFFIKKFWVWDKHQVEQQISECHGCHGYQKKWTTWWAMEALGYGVRMRLRPEFPRRFIVTLSPGRGLNKRQNAKQKNRSIFVIGSFRMFVSLKFKSLGRTVPKYLWWCHWKNLKWHFFQWWFGWNRKRQPSTSKRFCQYATVVVRQVERNAKQNLPLNSATLNLKIESCLFWSLLIFIPNHFVQVTKHQTQTGFQRPLVTFSTKMSK